MSIYKDIALLNGRLLELPSSPVLVVGDVHGCYHTFKKFVEDHWDAENEVLIQVGDLINRGRHSTECVRYARKLSKKYPGKVLFLLGNHEYRLLSYLKGKPNYKWVRKGSAQLLKDLSKDPDEYAKILKWIYKLPMAIETDYLFISHAGWSKKVRDPFAKSVALSLIHNRAVLKKMKKLQVIGHIPHKDGKPAFNERSNSWQIDTAACLGQQLTGLRIKKKGEFQEIIQVETDARDI